MAPTELLIETSKFDQYFDTTDQKSLKKIKNIERFK